MDLDPAAFGAKLSLEKSGRDRRGEKLLALSVENPPGQQLQKLLRDSGVSLLFLEVLWELQSAFKAFRSLARQVGTPWDVGSV